MNYNVWNKWDKLQTVMLGDCYDPAFFREIKNTRIKSALQRIASESQEDLEKFSNVLKEFGCEVLRPNLDLNDSIINHVNQDGQISSVARSPLQARDEQLVIGNKLFYTGVDHPATRESINKYNRADTLRIHGPLKEASFQGHKGKDSPDWPSYEEFIYRFCNNKPFSDNTDVHTEILDIQTKEMSSDFFPICAPSITVVGKDIYVDVAGVGRLPTPASTHLVLNTFDKHQDDPSQIWLDAYFTKFTKLFPNYRINFLNVGGHNDGCFHTVKPQAILSLREIQTYNDTFPNWDICYLQDQSWAKIVPFMKLKHENQGKWWVPGEEDNSEFTNFVETWLQDWVGYVEETVFDVNVLVLDEHHVCVSQPDNEIVNAFLKKHNMEPVYVPWRHRYFWDGGLHCITLDLKRQGTQQDYFPDRNNPIIDKGF